MGPSSFVQSHRPSRSTSHSVSYSDDSLYPSLVSILSSSHSFKPLSPSPSSSPTHQLNPLCPSFQSQLHTSRLSTSRLGMSTPTKRSLHGAWPVRLITHSSTLHLSPFACSPPAPVPIAHLPLSTPHPPPLQSPIAIVLCAERAPVHLPLILFFFFLVGRHNISIAYARLLGCGNNE